MRTSLIALLLLVSATAAAQQPADFVNPFIGTDGMGHTFPGACAPFGIVQLSPDTDTIPHNVDGRYQPRAYEYCAGYRHEDPTIVGFSHTHFSGTGHSDLGDILVMPSTGPVLLNPGTASDPGSGYRSRYSHDSETASPGYYAVTLSDYGIRAELSATQRVGAHRYTFPEGSDGHVVVDLQHGIYNYDGKTLWAEMRVENERLVTGYRITSGWARTDYTYFAIEFSQPVVEYGYTDRAPIPYRGGWGRFDQYHNFPEMAGRKLVAWFRFDTSSEPVVEMKVGISAVSAEGALKNLRAEAGGLDFDAVRKAAAASWNRELQSITVEGTPDQKAMFYTSYYHTMINPSVYMDVDGSYRGLDRGIHQAEGFTNYTVFSLWDTYRAEHPFLVLMKPDRARDMAVSMIRHQQQSVHGMLPVWSHMANENWCMSGYHAVSVLSDAMAKGLDMPLDEALDAMVSTSNVRYYSGLGEYIDLGWVPLEKSSTAASNTLEYCYDDWTIYSAAQRAGRRDVAETYRARALNYRNLFDPALGFARPRYSDGRWKEPFDALQTSGEGFIEGNSWNFSFHVPHDVPGIIAAMGGEKSFTARLDRLFSEPLNPVYYADNEDITSDCLIGGYVHGNEPSHHVPYLYAWTSQPWKTQYWLREVMNRMYRNDIRGLGGNDDCGQMSAWYIFTAMGFYPVCPGTDQYVLGAPYLPRVVLSLPGGGTFEILAPGVSDTRRYVREVRLNGKPYGKLYITHEDILAGGTLEFIMDSKPAKRRGLKAEDKPYSLSL
ncbi:MAG: GH92 family glycosyl hydrolase [Bacteroidales bacterium]|nr:GH92 family glycosyl hydrolase [Bacteroidales bacterium]